jgi:hypothetical protein
MWRQPKSRDAAATAHAAATNAAAAISAKASEQAVSTTTEAGTR